MTIRMLLLPVLFALMTATPAIAATEEAPAQAPVPAKGSWYRSDNTTANNWSKTGMSYEVKWKDDVDGVAGGNTTLELYVKALTPHTIEVFNAKKLGIAVVCAADGHPPIGGSIVLGNYATLTDQSWTKVSIPLADFAGADFKHVIMFAGLPQALGSGDYALGVDEIRFVGGPTPVLWYGDAHPNNPIGIHGAGMEVAYVAGGGVEMEAAAAPGGIKP